MFTFIATLLAQQRLGTINQFGKYNVDPNNPESGPQTLEEIFTVIFGFLTIVAGIAFLIYFVVGALGWITAGSDEKKLEDSKKIMTNGAIGLIIIVAAYSIISIVGTVLGFTILNPAETLSNLFNAGGNQPISPPPIY